MLNPETEMMNPATQARLPSARLLKRPLRLLIAIPAYNEEESIESIVERCLEAKEKIISESPVTDVEITVVSDGSVDRTVELAEQYRGEINLIIFETNRGYGAAIKEAWASSNADLLGFIDADGTCDPKFFANLCNLIEERGADVVLGSRMGPGSQMPFVRRLGNALFALMLSVFSSGRVRDTASGMRVVRRSSLPKLFPLPDGMHFTPAMSARAILSEDLRIFESEMTYHEREGRSKLRVFRDGLRFLNVILEAAFLYRPSRPLAILGLSCAAAGIALMIMPIQHYVVHRRVEEWMIYRFIVSHLAATTSGLFLCAAYVTGRIVNLVLHARNERSPVQRVASAFFASRLFWTVPAILFMLGGLLVVPSFIELVRTGATYEHWSRFIAMSALFSLALILIATWIVDYTLNLLTARVVYLSEQRL